MQSRKLLLTAQRQLCCGHCTAAVADSSTWQIPCWMLCSALTARQLDKRRHQLVVRRPCKLPAGLLQPAQLQQDPNHPEPAADPNLLQTPSQDTTCAV